MFQFGSGVLWGNPNGGNLANNPTPQRFGTLQDVNIDINQKLVELRGATKFPEDVAPGDMTIAGKAGFAKLNIDIYNNLFFGEQTATAGIVAIAQDEVQTIPAATPYTVSVANATGFQADYGVLYAATGRALTRVTATPAQGQYTVSAGVYTFAASDTGIPVLTSYSYSAPTVGRTLTVQNHLQGFGPVFALLLSQPYQGQNGMYLFACRASKLSQPMKRDGYQMVDFEFQAFANSAGLVAQFFQASN